MPRVRVQIRQSARAITEALAADLVTKDTPAVIVTHNRAFARLVGTRCLRLEGNRLVEDLNHFDREVG